MKNVGITDAEGIQTRPRHAGDGHDADGVLVADLQGLFDVERGLVEGQGHGAHLDLPQLAELLPYDLESGAHHEVRFVEGFAGGLAAVAPAEPCGHAAQHAGFRRADAQRSGLPLGLFGRVPQVCDDVQAASAHHRYAGILRFVDVVDVDGLVHQTCGVVVHVGRHESCQVQPRLGLGIGLVLDQLIGYFGCGLLLGDEFRRGRRTHLFRSENVCQGVLGCVFLLIHNAKILFLVYIVRILHELCHKFRTFTPA